MDSVDVKRAEATDLQAGDLDDSRPALVDPFGREISYLRVSVTDRCDFRCVYCMAEHMSFLPKADLLTLEELDRLCSAFIGRGVRKLRLTGGEPLVRRGIMTLFATLSRHLASGRLDELTLTTNGSQLAKHAPELAAIGVAIGLAAAAGLTRLMSSLLFGIAPMDPLTYAAVPAVLLAAALLASYLPARRAAAVDPVETLKAD